MSLYKHYVDIVRKRKQRRGIKLKPPVEYVTEEELREESAAVNDAWEQYQMLLKLQAGSRKVGKQRPKKKTRPLPR